MLGYAVGNLSLQALQKNKITLTGLRISGIKQNAIYANLTVFPKSILSFILKNANGVLITVTLNLKFPF